jgi:hypothetical protein
MRFRIRFRGGIRYCVHGVRNYEICAACMGAYFSLSQMFQKLHDGMAAYVRRQSISLESRHARKHLFIFFFCDNAHQKLFELNYTLYSRKSGVGWGWACAKRT